MTWRFSANTALTSWAATSSRETAFDAPSAPARPRGRPCSASAARKKSAQDAYTLAARCGWRSSSRSVADAGMGGGIAHAPFHFPHSLTLPTPWASLGLMLAEVSA